MSGQTSKGEAAAFEPGLEQFRNREESSLWGCSGLVLGGG